MASLTSQISFILLFLLFAATLNKSVVGLIRCNDNDQKLLLIFKQGVVDPYKQLSSWTIEQDCCSWEGVYCDNITGRVTELSLFSHKLEGEINLCVLRLEFLIHLDLSWNFFDTVNMPSCQISKSSSDAYKFDNQSLGSPSNQSARFSISLHYLNFSSYGLVINDLNWLSQLSSLEYLDLSYNDIGNEIKWLHYIAMLPSLTELHLSRCALRDFSSLDYTNFTSLEVLDLSYNFHLMPKLPNSFYNITNHIYHLDLSGNGIRNETKWLQYIAMLPSLSKLHLSQCGLRDFSCLNYINFTSLEVLDLSHNFYMMKSKLPNSFFNITSHIYHLDLSDCTFYGQLPKALLNLQNLKHLDLSRNNLQGSIPDWLGKYEQLQFLGIGDNSFNGVIPSSLGNISSLFYLRLSYNKLRGNLPGTLGQLHNLNQLHIGHNFLVGVLTEIFFSNFSNFSNLKSLDLSSTSSEFEIHPKWVPPFQLEHLDLGNTSIGPNVPTWLYTQQSLSYLDISRSGISTIDADVFWSFVAGIDYYVDISYNLISADISNVKLSANITRFDVSHNSLSGSLFSLLCQLESNVKNELYLDLSYNRFGGALPDCGANWMQLRELNLGNNKLTGKVPPSMASLVDLRLLDLSHNSFFGNFSVDLTNWKYLEYLVLDGNRFSGSLPSLPNTMHQELYVIKLRGNQFIGNIPSQLCNLTCLIILDLADNKLSGSIPRCLNKIMQRFWSFYPVGEIKVFAKGRELGYEFYPFVYSVDLSANNLSGEIPKELLNLTQMWSLNLSRNHLIGKIPKEIGDMEKLESLDLSYNKLSGEIPSTILNLSFLDWLNLSYNNFIGQIPLGTQIQSFESWSFVGNVNLCGDPLPNKCYKKEDSHNSKSVEKNEDDNFLKSLYLGMGVGFAVGFWGICGSLFLIRTWRHKFFQLFHLLVDRLYVIVALNLTKV